MNFTPLLNVCPRASATLPFGPSMVTCLTVVQVPLGFFLKESHGNPSIIAPPIRDYTPQLTNVNTRLAINGGRIGCYDCQVIRENLAKVNARASQRSVLISPECVTGYLIPSGTAEVGPHGIGDQVPYLPGFVLRGFEKQGIVGLAPKYDEHGNPLPPRWVGMTARIEGGQSRNARFVVLHAFRNVSKPLSDGVDRKGQATFCKIVGPNEPNSYTFTASQPPR